MSTVDTKIEWTDCTWNPVRGCSRISPGCGGAAGVGGCYAEKVAGRFSGPGLPYEGLATIGKNGARWTGKVRLIESALSEPLRWRKPQRIFVNSMSDLFHESLTDEQIAAVFGVMAATPQHTFQVLTKRAERMVAWFEWVAHEVAKGNASSGRHLCVCIAEQRVDRPIPTTDGWPLPNVWLGVSVEDQQRADERIPHLLRVPAAVRFLSVEPLLGEVDLSPWLWRRCSSDHGGCGSMWPANQSPPCSCARPWGAPFLHWVIVGGESGPGARPCDLAWIRSIVAQCRAAGVAPFFKQAGAYARGRDEDQPHPFNVGACVYDRARLILGDRKGGDLDELPADIGIREFPDVRP